MSKAYGMRSDEMVSLTSIHPFQSNIVCMDVDETKTSSHRIASLWAQLSSVELRVETVVVRIERDCIHGYFFEKIKKIEKIQNQASKDISHFLLFFRRFSGFGLPARK